MSRIPPIARPSSPDHVRLRFICVVLAMLVTGSDVGAQVRPGFLVGRVVNEQQEPIAGATVELSRFGQVIRRTTTNIDGAFQFPAVPEGSYWIRAQQIGFRRGSPVAAMIAPSDTRVVTLTLQVQPVELEGLDVVTSPLSIQRENVEFTTEITEEQIALLPTTYEARDLVELTPGARAEHVWGGATIQANNYQFDGLPANHPGLGGDLVQPSINWIESIEVRGLGAGAEYGDFQGGLINLVTKSGSNDFQGAFRSTFETHHLNADNLVRQEVGSELAMRHDMEGEVRGAIVRDRLFYYLAAQRINSERRFQDHLPFGEGDRVYAEVPQSHQELKGFAKATWRPTGRDEVEGSVGYFDTSVDRHGMTGYEAPEATLRLKSPTIFYHVAWRRIWANWLSTKAKLARFTLDQTREPYNGAGVPGLQFYGMPHRYPPEPSYQNAPIHYRHQPESASAGSEATLRFSTFGSDHMLRVGGEHTVGSFLDQRQRSGGLTWRPTRRRSLVVDDPVTWRYPPQQFIPVTTGGEVDLHAEVQSSAAYIQGSFAFGNHVALSPGLRWGRWEGRLLPGGDRSRGFTAVTDQAWSPRIGLMIDATGDNTFVAKAHWGRYHQGLIAQLFDRVEGGEVFTNEQLWYYLDVPAHPYTTFTEDQLAGLQEAGLLRLHAEQILNETGPAQGYRQPYVDQWIVGLEKTFGRSVRLEAVYVNRRNRNMLALVDLNRQSNYTVYNRVQVLDPSGVPLSFEGGTVYLDQVLVPNNRLLDRLLCFGRGFCGFGEGAPPFPPGLTLADTANLTWNPQYVLTTAPGAQRRFDQLQLSVEVLRPTWGASGSWVFTDLRGNLDNVTGYDDPLGYGAGPYVRVNEGVNSYGKLPNVSEEEMKLSIWGDLLWDLRGGLFWIKATGDHFSPRFTITDLAGYRYSTAAGDLHPSFLVDLEGHTVFLGRRGLPRLRDRVRFDAHLEREFRVRALAWTLSLDLFNVLNYSTTIRVNPSANLGRNYYHFLPPDPSGLRPRPDPNEFYKASLERVPPRTLRIGLVMKF